VVSCEECGATGHIVLDRDREAPNLKAYGERIADRARNRIAELEGGAVPLGEFDSIAGWTAALAVWEGMKDDGEPA
jgi:hypothetical protein